MALTREDKMRLVAADKLSTQIRMEYGGGHKTWLRLWSNKDISIRIVLMKSPWHKMKGEPETYIVGMFHNDYVDAGMVPLSVVAGFEVALGEYGNWVALAERDAIPEVIAPLSDSPLADVMIEVFGAEAMTIRRGEKKGAVIDRLIKSIGEQPGTPMGDILGND